MVNYVKKNKMKKSVDILKKIVYNKSIKWKRDKKMTFYNLLETLDDKIDLYVVIDENGRTGNVEDFKTINGFYDFIVKSVKLDKDFNELNIFLQKCWQIKQNSV